MGLQTIHVTSLSLGFLVCHKGDLNTSPVSAYEEQMN